MTDIKELYSSRIANCIFNAFLCYTTIVLNTVTIHAIRKTSSLPKPLKTLLLCLAVSDLGVGLLVQPLYIAYLVMKLASNTENNPAFNTTFLGFWYAMNNLLSYASFFCVTALSVDRFLAIHLHLRYKELVTHKRVVAVVTSIWVISAFLSFLWLIVAFEWTSMNIKFFYAICASIEVACLITTAVLYCKIYLAVRHHAHHIRALQVRQETQNGEMENSSSLRKYAMSTFYVYLVFLVCYLPQNCLYFAFIISGTSITVDIFSLYSSTLVFLNSSLNPLIYCWKMKDVRHTVINILRKILSSQTEEK